MADLTMDLEHRRLEYWRMLVEAVANPSVQLGHMKMD
jgi:hypothetical protein